MAILTNKIQKIVDLPVWEWMRFAPTATAAVSSLCTSDLLNSRYLYYTNASTLFRYDVITDSWGQLANPIVAPVTCQSTRYTTYGGYWGRCISASNALAGVGTLNAIPTAAGSNYIVGDVLTITTGGTGATVTVSSVDGSGGVAGFTLLSSGTSYTIGAGKATSGGTGSSCTLEILTLSATITGPGLWGNILKGYKIRIFSGTGAGQERTIINVAEPVTADWGVTTGGTALTITDTAKGWATNQWVGYQLRITNASTAAYTQYRKIIYNDSQIITFADNNFAGLDAWFYNGSLAVTAAANMSYQIESSVFTVDSPWTTAPDFSSKFCILSGGIWLVSANAGAPFYNLTYYDVATDAWYYKSTMGGLVPAALATDVSIERTGEVGGILLTGTATSVTARTVVENSKGMTPGRYANHQVRITGGTLGVGQRRKIVWNTSDTLILNKSFDTTPTGTVTYAIYPDTDAFYMVGNGASATYLYSVEADNWSTGHTVDWGVCRTLAVKVAGMEAFGVSTITRAATGNTTLVVNNGGVGYLPGQTITVSGGGGSGCTATVTSITTRATDNAPGVVTGLTLLTSGTTYTAGSARATTGGTGTGLTVDNTVAADVATVTVATNYNIKVGDSVAISGATGADAGKYNGTFTVIAALNTATKTFNYVLGSTPGGGATFVALSQNLIVDCTKSWTTNEHVGRLVQVSVAGVGGAGQTRRVLSNDAISLTIGTVAGGLQAAAVTVAGTNYKVGDIVTVNTGTGGTAVISTIVAATGAVATFGILNPGSGYAISTLYATTGGSGSGFTLTTTATGVFTGLITAPTNGTTRYIIMEPKCPGTDSTFRGPGQEPFGVATSAGTNTLTDTTKAWPAGLWTCKRVRIIAGTSTGSESVITTNTATQITVNPNWANGTPDATSVYQIMDNFGMCTALGTAAGTLIDHTQNWTVNQWANRRVKMTSGTGQSQEALIASNTVNTLTTAAAITTAPTTDTAYAILSAPNKGAGVQLQWAYDTTDTAYRGKYMFCARGGATNSFDRYDITKQTWDLLSVSPQAETFTTGTMYSYDGTDRIYFVSGTPIGAVAATQVTGRLYYYDIPTNMVVASSTVPFGMGGALIGNRLEIVATTDGLKYLYVMRHTGQEMWRTLIYW